MNCEDEKEKSNNSLTPYTGEKTSKKKELPLFNAFDDFKIDYSFHKQKKSCSGVIKNSLNDGNDSSSDDNKDDLKKLIQIINHNYIDKHFYFKKLSIHDLYKIFVYSNFLTKSLILYPSLIPHFERIIEKLKKIKHEPTLPGVEDDHFVFPPLDLPPNEGHRLQASSFIQSAALSSGLVKNETNTTQDATQNAEKKAFLLNVGKDSKSRNSFISTELDEEENDIGQGENARGRHPYGTRYNHLTNTNCDKINSGSFSEVQNKDKISNCNYNRQATEQKKNSDLFPYEGPSNYAPANVGIKNAPLNSTVNVKSPCAVHNSHTKNATSEYDRGNGNNGISRDNPSVSIPSVDKNVRVYKNINEYDIIELKISASFNNKYICRYIGIHSGMTLYNIHRCICICLGVKKEDTDNYLHVFILNNGNIYGSGKKCSVSIIRKIQINTDRHITFKHIVKTPLYLYKAKDASKNNFSNDFPVNCTNTFDDKACPNGESQYGAESNPNEVIHSENESTQNSGGPSENNPHENSPSSSDHRIADANLYNPDPHSRNVHANVNVMDISNFGESSNGHTFVASNTMPNYDMLNSMDSAGEMNHCNVSIPTLSTIGKANKFSNLTNSSSTFYTHVDSNMPHNHTNNISNNGRSIYGESLNRGTCNRIMRCSNSSQLSAGVVGEYLRNSGGANINSGHANGGMANRNCSYDASESNINLSNFPIQSKNMKTNEVSNNAHLNENHSDVELQNDSHKVGDNNDCDVKGPSSSENYAREDDQEMEDATAEDDYKREKYKKGECHKNGHDQNGSRANRKHDIPLRSTESTYADATHADEHPLNKLCDEAQKVVSPNTRRDTCYLYMNSQEENHSCTLNTMSSDSSPYKHAMSAISPTTSHHPFDHPLHARNNYTFSAQQNDTHSYHPNGMNTSEQHEFANEELQSNYPYPINLSPQFNPHIKFNHALSMHNVDEKNGAQSGQIMDDADYPTIDSNCQDDGSSNPFLFPTSTFPNYPYNLNGINTTNYFLHKNGNNLTLHDENAPNAHIYNDPMHNQENHIEYQNVMNNTFHERDFSNFSNPNWCIPYDHFPQSNNATYANGSTASSYMDNSFAASPLDNTFNPQQTDHYWNDAKCEQGDSSKSCKNKDHSEISEPIKHNDVDESAASTQAEDNAMRNIVPNSGRAITNNYPPWGNYNSTSITHVTTHLNSKMESQENHTEMPKETTADVGKEQPQNDVQPDAVQRHPSGRTDQEGEPNGTNESATNNCINREDEPTEKHPLEDDKIYKGVQCGSIPTCSKNENEAQPRKDEMNHTEKVASNHASCHNDAAEVEKSKIKEQTQKMKDSPPVEETTNGDMQKGSEASKEIINSEEEASDCINSDHMGDRKTCGILSTHSMDDEHATEGGGCNPVSCNSVCEQKLGDGTHAQEINQDINTKENNPQMENAHISNISNTCHDDKNSTSVRTEQNGISNFCNTFNDTENGMNGRKSHQEVGCSHTGKSHTQKKERKEEDYSYSQSGENTSPDTHLVCEQNGSSVRPTDVVQSESIKNGSTYEHTHEGKTNVQGKTEVLPTSADNSTKELHRFSKLNGDNAPPTGDATTPKSDTAEPILGREEMETKEKPNNSTMDKKENYEKDIKQGTQIILTNDNFNEDNEGSHFFTSEQREGNIPPKGLTETEQLILEYHPHLNEELNSEEDAQSFNDQNTYMHHIQKMVLRTPHENSSGVSSNMPSGPMHTNQISEFETEDKDNLCLEQNAKGDCKQWEQKLYQEYFYTNSQMNYIEGNTTPCSNTSPRTAGKVIPKEFTNNFHKTNLFADYNPYSKSTNAMVNRNEHSLNLENKNNAYHKTSLCFKKDLSNTTYMQVDNDNGENDCGNHDNNPYHMTMLPMNDKNGTDFFTQGKQYANNGSLHTTSNTLMTVDTAVDTTDYMHSMKHSSPHGSLHNTEHGSQHGEQQGNQGTNQRSKPLNTNPVAEENATYFPHFNTPERVNENYPHTLYNIMSSEKAIPEQPPFYVDSNCLNKEADQTKFTSSLCGTHKPSYHPPYSQNDNPINSYNDYSCDASTYMMNNNANDYSNTFRVDSLRNANMNVIKEDTYYGSVNQGMYLNMNEVGMHSTPIGTFMHVDEMRQRGCATTHDMASNHYVQIMPNEEDINLKHLPDDNMTISECINSSYAKGGNERDVEPKERSSEQEEGDSEQSEKTFEENKSSFSMLYLFGKVKFNISIIDIIHNKTNSHDLLWVPRCCNGSYGTFLKNNYLNANEIDKHVPEEHIDIDCINLKLMETRFSKNVASSRTTKRKRMIDIDKTVLHFYKEHISEFFNNKNKIIKLTKKLCKYKKKRKYNSSDNGKCNGKATSKSYGKGDEENNAHPYEKGKCVNSKTANKTKYKGKKNVSRQDSIAEDTKGDPSMDGENGAERSEENDATCDHQNDPLNESDAYAQSYPPNYVDETAHTNYYHQLRDHNRDYYHYHTRNQLSANQMHAANAGEHNYLINEHVNRNVNKMAIQNELLQNDQIFNDPFVNNMLSDMSTRNVNKNNFYPNIMYHQFSEHNDVLPTDHQFHHEMGPYSNVLEEGSPNGDTLNSLPPTTYYNQPMSQYFMNNNPNAFKSNFANNANTRKGKNQNKSQMSSFNPNDADTKSALHLSQILEGNNNFINISNTFINTNFAKDLHQTNDLLVNQNNFDVNVMSGGLNANHFTQ
ncbi:hypothetical protein AK88_05273 [Plasmodium fragile]|uniref:Uncharacterized protein n=2 Tax=Plasmodium fragile TaxID=5857 RepID=A0A0D9QDS2_PLAFR|nr:uncharacterized protein AK88_05273 [Plasmodium fragile]KJP85104.1 hypothetical protein AK88_05273 [Plasmodium fragile]